MLKLWLMVTGLALADFARADVSLHQGRYLGWLQPAGADHKIAVTMDLFVVKPDDPEAFPKQTALLKLGLGGLQSGEYVTETYDGVQFDFTDGVLTMGGVTNDVTLTGKVTGNAFGQNLIDGQVFIRSAAKSGLLHLVEQSDDPEADPGTVPGEQYLPLLSGQYDGACGNHQVVLQIETGRGIAPDSTDHHGLAAYAIRGRLGMHDDEATCPDPIFCAMRNYTSGTYDFVLGRLLLNGGYPDDCKVLGTGLTCTVHYGADTYACTLAREATPVAPPVYYQRTEFLPTTPAQLAALPAPNPPANTDLINALQGDFIGYLHHERDNHYQVMSLSVMAYSSTDNPHNPNLVYVSGASVLHFGPTVSDEFFVQQFEPRSFYLVPGFTLASPAADAFLQVDKWRQGYVHGVWYSHAFGRVGTFELVKGPALPPLSAHAKVTPSIVGAFVGPHGTPGEDSDFWWLNFLVPTQQPRANLSTLAFQGQFQVRDGALPRLAIDHGNYDFYAGAIAWVGSEGRMPYGTVTDGPSVNLFMPGAPIWDVIMDTDHTFYPYRR